MSRRIAIFIFVLIISPVAGAEELLQNRDFDSGLDNWLHWWGDTLTHTTEDGHLTSGGAARMEGHVDNFAGVGQVCIDVSGQPADSYYYAAASIKPSEFATETPITGVIVDYYIDSDCSTAIGSRQILESTPAGVWSRVGDFFSPPPEAQGFAIIVLALGTPDGGVTLFDDATLIVSPVAPEELLENTGFTGDVDPWLHWWGDLMSHNAADGHLTPGGAAQMDGHVDSFAGVGQRCIDISGRPPGSEFFAAASMKADALAPGNPIRGVIVDYFMEPNCGTFIDSRQILAFTPAGAWARVGSVFSPPPEARSIGVILLVFGTPDGGTTLFDDATVTATAPTFFDGFESGDVSAWSQ